MPKSQQKGAYKQTHTLVATWIPNKDCELLQALATRHKVSFAAYIRAIITDALSDERCKL